MGNRQTKYVVFVTDAGEVHSSHITAYTYDQAVHRINELIEQQYIHEKEWDGEETADKLKADRIKAGKKLQGFELDVNRYVVIKELI